MKSTINTKNEFSETVKAQNDPRLVRYDNDNRKAFGAY